MPSLSKRPKIYEWEIFELTPFISDMAFALIEPTNDIHLKRTHVSGYIDNSMASLIFELGFDATGSHPAPNLIFALGEGQILSRVTVKRDTECDVYEYEEIPQGQQVSEIDSSGSFGRSMNSTVLMIGSVSTGQLIEVTAEIHVTGSLLQSNQVSFDIPFLPASSGTLLSADIDVQNTQDLQAVSVRGIPSEFANSRLTIPETPLTDALTLLVETRDAISPSAITATIRGEPYIGLTLLAPPCGRVPTAELIVLIDVSGSMVGEKLAHAKLAMSALIHKFHPACYFNVIAFESRFTSFFPETVPCSPANIAIAQATLEGLVDLGGTCLLEPLEFVCRQPPRRGFVRQLLLLTDGQIEHRQDVLSLISEHRSDHRVISFGIGYGCDHAFFNELSIRSGGHAEFLVGGGSAISDAVDRQWQFCQSSLDQTVVNVRAQLEGCEVLKFSPCPPPSLFANSLTHLFLWGFDASKAPQTVTITGESGDANVELRVPVRRQQTSTGLDKWTMSQWIKDAEEKLARTAPDEVQKVVSSIVSSSIEAGVPSALTTMVQRPLAQSRRLGRLGATASPVEASQGEPESPPPVQRYQPLPASYASRRLWMREQVQSQAGANPLCARLAQLRPVTLRGTPAQQPSEPAGMMMPSLRAVTVAARPVWEHGEDADLQEARSSLRHAEVAERPVFEIGANAEVEDARTNLRHIEVAERPVFEIGANAEVQNARTNLRHVDVAAPRVFERGENADIQNAARSLKHVDVVQRPAPQHQDNEEVRNGRRRLRPVPPRESSDTPPEGNRGNEKPESPFGARLVSRPLLSEASQKRIFQEGEFGPARQLSESPAGERYHYRHSTTESEYIVKVLPPIASFVQSMVASFYEAIDEKGELKHPLILPVIKFRPPEKSQHFLVCSEFCPNGSLGDIISGPEPPEWWDSTRKAITIVGTCQGLRWLHDHKRVHGALRPAKILFDEETNPIIGEFFYADFWRARLMTRTVAKREVSYDAPEVDKGSFTEKSDIFSWGLTMIAALTKSHNAATGRISFRKPKWSAPGLNPTVVKIIDRCLDNSPDRRPSCQEILSDLAQIGYRLFPDVEVEVIRSFAEGQPS
jgi:hypothetical protein